MAISNFDLMCLGSGKHFSVDGGVVNFLLGDFPRGLFSMGKKNSGAGGIS